MRFILLFPLILFSIISFSQTNKTLKFTSESYRLMQRQKVTDEWNTQDIIGQNTVFYETTKRKITVYAGDQEAYYDVLSVKQEQWDDSTSNTVMVALSSNKVRCSINIIVVGDNTLCVHIAFDTIEITYWINNTEIRKD